MCVGVTYNKRKKTMMDIYVWMPGNNALIILRSDASGRHFTRREDKRVT